MAGTEILGIDLQGAGFLLAGLPGGWEWIVVLLAILLLFGRRIPTLARNLGQGISSFKKGLNDPADEGEKKKAKKKRDENDEDDDEEADAA